jgi:integrase
MRSPEKIERKGDPARGVKPYHVYRVRFPHGVKTYRRFKDAEAAIREHETQSSAGVDIDSRTVDQVLDELTRARYSAASAVRTATRNQARLAAEKISAAFGAWPLGKLRQRHVEDWVAKLVEGTRERQTAKVEAIKARYAQIAKDKRGSRGRRMLAVLEGDSAEIAARIARTGPRAANKALAHLRRLYAFAVERRYVAFNPTDGVRMVKAQGGVDRPIDTNVLNLAEIGALVAAAEPEHRAALLVLAYGGLRIGELVALTWGDLELAKRRLRVSLQREGTTGDLTEPKTAAGRRFVELPSIVVTALREHELRAKKDSPEFVFPYHVRRFRSDVFFPALRRAKLRRIRLHDLRHTAASLMIATGADIAAVSRQLGHANVAITLGIYTHAFAKRTESGIGSKLDQLIKTEAGAAGGGTVLVPFAGTDAEKSA